jgi:hypothetical protein
MHIEVISCPQVRVQRRVRSSAEVRMAESQPQGPFAPFAVLWNRRVIAGALLALSVVTFGVGMDRWGETRLGLLVLSGFLVLGFAVLRASERDA